MKINNDIDTRIRLTGPVVLRIQQNNSDNIDWQWVLKVKISYTVIVLCKCLSLYMFSFIFNFLARVLICLPIYYTFLGLMRSLTEKLYY